MAGGVLAALTVLSKTPLAGLKIASASFQYS